MDLQATKMELIEMLLSTRKLAVLKKVKAILEEEQTNLSKEDYQIIDARRENHINGKSKSYSWQEAKQKIVNR